MQLKTFRLKEGKLEFIGLREPKTGDCIVEGETSMAEVIPGVLALRESSTSDFPMLFGKPAPPTQAELARARQSLKGKDKEALANSYKQTHPQATPAEISAFCQGRAPDPPCESLDDSLRKSNPEWTDAQIAIFKKGR